MVKFELYSELQKGKLKIKYKDRDDVIHITKPFYKDTLEIDWETTHYTIIRSGMIVRGAKIYKEKEYLGKVEEKIGFMTHFDIYHKAKKLFAIHEHEQIFNQYFDILKAGGSIGKIKAIGIYVPIISNLGKGLEGEYSGITKDEEEILLMSIIALGA